MYVVVMAAAVVVVVVVRKGEERWACGQAAAERERDQ